MEQQHEKIVISASLRWVKGTTMYETECVSMVTNIGVMPHLFAGPIWYCAAVDNPCGFQFGRSDMAVHADQGNLMLSDMAVRATRHDYFSAQAARAELLRPLTTMNPSALKVCSDRLAIIRNVCECDLCRTLQGCHELHFPKQ